MRKRAQIKLLLTTSATVISAMVAAAAVSWRDAVERRIIFKTCHSAPARAQFTAIRTGEFVRSRHTYDILFAVSGG